MARPKPVGVGRKILAQSLEACGKEPLGTYVTGRDSVDANELEPVQYHHHGSPACAFALFQHGPELVKAACADMQGSAP